MQAMEMRNVLNILSFFIAEVRFMFQAKAVCILLCILDEPV